MIIVYIIAGSIGIFAALGMFDLIGRACDRYDKWYYKRQQRRRVMAMIRGTEISMFHRRQAD